MYEKQEFIITSGFCCFFFLVITVINPMIFVTIPEVSAVTRYKVEGRVMDIETVHDSPPEYIEGATVSLYRLVNDKFWRKIGSDTSDNSGYYYIYGAYRGEYHRLVATHPNCNTQRIYFTPYSNKWIDIHMVVNTPPDVKIYGYVHNDLGHDLGGAIVQLYDQNGILQKETTSRTSDGYYEIITPRNYHTCTLKTMKTNYETKIESIIPSESKRKDITLEEYEIPVIEGNTYDLYIKLAKNGDDACFLDSDNYPYYADWKQTNSFILAQNNDDYSLPGYGRARSPRAASYVEFHPIWCATSPDSGTRDLEFELVIRGFAYPGGGRQDAGSGYLEMNWEPNLVVPRLDNPWLTSWWTNMQYQGNNPTVDSLEIYRATVSSLKHKYAFIGDLDDNIIRSPGFDESTWNNDWDVVWSDSTHTVTIDIQTNPDYWHNRAIRLYNSDDKDWPFCLRQGWTNFAQPQRYITAFYEGCRLDSIDSGTGVGLDLYIRLNDGSYHWYMPSELRMGQYDTEWRSHHIVIDAESIWGAGKKIVAIQPYLLNYERGTAVMDNVYVGPFYHDLGSDPDNAGTLVTSVLDDWKAEQAAADEFGEQLNAVSKGLELVSKANELLPYLSGGKSVPGVGQVVGVANFLIERAQDALPKNLWHAEGTAILNARYSYGYAYNNVPYNAEYRPTTGETILCTHAHLSADSSEEQVIQIRVGLNYIVGNAPGLSGCHGFTIEHTINIHIQEGFF